jgi:hypothetical protein
MTRPRRWRWWGKWVTLAIAAAIALAWLGSRWYCIQIDCRPLVNREVWLGVQYGRILCDTGDPSWPKVSAAGAARATRSPRGAFFSRNELDTWFWSFSRGHYIEQAAGAAVDVHWSRVPLWAILLPVAGTSAFLWWLDRKPEPGRCPRCGYDISATPPSAPCPECGRGRQSPNAETSDRITS